MLKDRYCSRSNCRFNHPNKMKNMHEIRNGKHGINYNQNQRGPKRQENQNMQGNPNMGNPAAWQNNNRDRYQCPSGTSFLAGPTPSEAYRNPNRNINMIKMLEDMFQEMSSRIIMNMGLNY